MDYFDTIESRYSCRKFTEEKISKEMVDKILHAAVISPTAVNFQPERIFVVENPEVLEALKEATKYTFDAKTIFVVCYDNTVSWHRRSDNKDHGDIDAAIVATQMTLAVTALGLGSTYVCAFKPEVVKKVLNLPDNYVVSFLLPVGYKAEEKRERNRKDINEIVTYI